MSFSITQVLLFAALYLSGLFAVAHLADRGIIPRRITHHPATYVLSLGVFAGAMASNGVVDLAYRHGYNFLLYYIGVGTMFLLAALLLMPLLRLCRVYQLASLADLLTFRFRSPRVGAAITIAMCIAMLPLLALQIQAVGDSVHILTGRVGNDQPGMHHQGIALLICVVIIAFAILFGTRHVSSQQRNTGLVTAMAFESLVKLAALGVLMFTAVYQIFDGPAHVQQWLLESPVAHQQMTHQLAIENAHALMLVFFAGAVCMPHIFHMMFAENTESRDLRTATWGLPLYLMLLSLPVLPVAWAGIRLEHSLPIEFSGLAMGLKLQSTGVVAVAFVATLSAASASIVVTTLALANMCLNHLVLPSRFLKIVSDGDIYRHLKWLRRVLITVLILGGYLFYLSLSGRQSLTELALVAFSGTLQFLPGIVATPYWPNANRRGLLAGLWAGLGFWFLTLMLPATRGYVPAIGQLLSPIMDDNHNLWSIATMISLGLNLTLFTLVSLLTRTSEEEQVAAEICSMDDLSRPTRQILSLHSAAEFRDQLAPALGERVAQAEVERALTELHFTETESRPYALRRLRYRIEANLSGLLGPAVAHSIIERSVPFLSSGTEDINLIERHLDSGHVQFTGLAADLNNLRRRYRETLDTLPVGVCSLGADGEMLMWNRSMEQITDVPADNILGSLLDNLPQPWQAVLANFNADSSDTLLKAEVTTDANDPRWISLHKTGSADGDTIILVEDITDYSRLETELLHSERLASVGRLAAGVAHEIGNPVTGIACLAQNLEYATDTEEVQATAQDILKQTGRVTRIVESLVNFSHAGSNTDSPELRACNLADCVDEAVHLLNLDREAQQVRFSNHCDRELVVLADSQRLLQVFINLLSNARDACDDQGHVQVQAFPEPEHVLIDIDDNGTGIPGELQSQIFEPFFTTKDPGLGTGLGLALVYSIMDDMGGSVNLTSPLQEGPMPGSRFTLQLATASYGPEFEV